MGRYNQGFQYNGNDAGVAVAQKRNLKAEKRERQRRGKIEN